MVKIFLALMVFSFQCWGTIYLTVSGANVKRAKIAMGQVHPMEDALYRMLNFQSPTYLRTITK